MSKPSLFQYAIVWHPTEDQIKEKGKKSIILIPPTTILAANSEAAGMAAAMQIPAEHKDNLDQIQICIINF